jgi:NAD-dependent DNA ligase
MPASDVVAQTPEQICAAAYAEGAPIVTDAEYDAIADRAVSDGETPAIGPRPRGRTITLPVWMGSLDKSLGAAVTARLSNIPPDDTLIITDKLDGISALVVVTTEGTKMYSRGDGAVGQDISHLLHKHRVHEDVVEHEPLMVRGELVMDRIAFQKRHSGAYANPRNMVAGCANSATVDDAVKADIHFVAYEVMSCTRHKSPSQQLDWLTMLGFETVNTMYRSASETTHEFLATLLADRKVASRYELDGLVLAQDKTYTLITTGNPETAFAFKDPVAQETAVVEVKSVLWDASRFRRLIPVVTFSAVQLSGVMVSRATAHNYDFVQTRGIGVGALIRIVRSGEVIPKILETVRRVDPATPDVPHTVSGVQAIANAALCPTKRMTHFFAALSVRNAGPATIERLVAAGCEKPADVAAMDPDDAHTKAGTVLAASIPAALTAAVRDAELGTVLAATGAFGPGIGETMLKSVFALHRTRDPRTLTAREIAEAPGVGPMTAAKIVDGLEGAYAYIDGLVDEAVQAGQGAPSIGEDADTSMAGEVVVFSGCRDKTLQAKLEKAGAKVSSSGNAATILIVKSSSDAGSIKAVAAIKAGAKIMTLDKARERTERRARAM